MFCQDRNTHHDYCCPENYFDKLEDEVNPGREVLLDEEYWLHSIQDE